MPRCRGTSDEHQGRRERLDREAREREREPREFDEIERVVRDLNAVPATQNGGDDVVAYTEKTVTMRVTNAEGARRLAAKHSSESAGRHGTIKDARERLERENAEYQRRRAELRREAAERRGETQPQRFDPDLIPDDPYEGSARPRNLDDAVRQIKSRGPDVLAHFFPNSKTSSSGGEMQFQCPAPDHEDLKPSASMNVETSAWCCYRCGETYMKGDALTLVAIATGLDLNAQFPEVVDTACDALGIIPRPAHAPISSQGPGPSATVGTSALLAPADGLYRFDDLTEALAGRCDPPKPGLLYREDGVGLYYRARVNMQYGVDSAGKTWVSHLAGLQALKSGGCYMHFDYDDTDGQAVERLRGLGATTAELTNGFLHKTDPDMITPADVNAIIGYRNARFTADSEWVIVLDVLVDALVAHGRDENDATDFVEWLNAVAMPLARAGATVIINDHPVKNGDSGGFGKGTAAKRQKTNGVYYEVKADTPMTRGEGGIVSLTVWKDRNGWIGKREKKVARIIFTPELKQGPDDPEYSVRICVPMDTSSGGVPGGRRDPRLSNDMQQVSDAIACEPGINFNALVAATFGSRKLKKALAPLVDEGWITSSSGKQNSKLYEVVIPYCAARDPRSSSFSQADCDRWSGSQNVPPYPDRLQ